MTLVPVDFKKSFMVWFKKKERRKMIHFIDWASLALGAIIIGVLWIIIQLKVWNERARQRVRKNWEMRNAQGYAMNQLLILFSENLPAMTDAKISSEMVAGEGDTLCININWAETGHTIMRIVADPKNPNQICFNSRLTKGENCIDAVFGIEEDTLSLLGSTIIESLSRHVEDDLFLVTNGDLVIRKT